MAETPKRDIRIEDALWVRVRAKADRLGTTASGVVRQLLIAWLAEEPEG